jgi:hypothetical protein
LARDILLASLIGIILWLALAAVIMTL